MGSVKTNSDGFSGILAQHHVLNENIQLLIQKGSGEGPRSYAFDSCGDPMVELGFNLGGTIRCVLPNRFRPRVLESVCDQAHISVYRKCSGTLEFLGDQPVYWLGILLPLDVFRSFFDIALADQASQSASGEQDVLCKLVGPINAGMKLALHQIMMCPFLGKTRCLFLESKVLELISYVRFCADRDTYAASSIAAVNLMADDRERMWHAKTILDENLESPPSILELARLVGVNEFKLKNGFRQVHGLTPYKYLAEQRLEKARQLLLERRMNVTEVAFAVGYSSLSHFAKIFRTKFGVNPHEFLAGTEQYTHPTRPSRQFAYFADTEAEAYGHALQQATL